MNLAGLREVQVTGSSGGEKREKTGQASRGVDRP